MERGAERSREQKHVAINEVLHQHPAKFDRLEVGDTGLIKVELVLFFQLGLPYLLFFFVIIIIFKKPFKLKNLDGQSVISFEIINSQL